MLAGEMFADKSLKRTTALPIGCIILIIYCWCLYQFNLYLAGLGVLLAMIIFIRKKPIFLLTIVLLALCTVRFNYSLDKLARVQSLYGQKITVTGTAIVDSTYDDQKRRYIIIDNLRLSNNQPLAGRMRVSSFQIWQAYSGQKIMASGKIYPSKGIVTSQMGYADIVVIDKKMPTLTVIRRYLTNILYENMTHSAANMAVGVLIGQRTDINQDIIDDFKNSGLTHIIAVSGYNLSIIAVLLTSVLKYFSKFRSVLLSVSAVTLYIFICGIGASIFRAYTVFLLITYCSYFGRKIKPHLLISLTALITIIYNPIYLWRDLGWWLSMLAFFGLLFMFDSANSFSLTKIKSLLQEALASSIMTAPFILFNFKFVSYISILANIFVVPLIPIIMLISGFVLFFGLFWPFMAQIFGFLATFMINLMLEAARYFSEVPWSHSNVSIDLPMIIFTYITVVSFLILKYHFRTKHRNMLEYNRLAETS